MRGKSSNVLVPILESVVFVIVPFATAVDCEASSNATVSGSLSCVAPLKWCVSSAFQWAPRAGGHVRRANDEPDVGCATTQGPGCTCRSPNDTIGGGVTGNRNSGASNVGSVMLDRLQTSISSSVFTWCAEKGADGDWEQDRVGFSRPRTAERGQSPSVDARSISLQSWYTRRSEFKAGTRTSLPCGTRPWMKPTCVKKETLAASRCVQSFFLLSWSVAIVPARPLVTKKRSSKRNNTVCRVLEGLGKEQRWSILRMH